MSIPLTVVMPVYNEQDAIVRAIDDVRTHILDVVKGAELVVVDDGSRDGTAALLDCIAASDARVRVIHQANAGHGGAIMTGLAAAAGEYVFLVDSDRQIPLTGFADAWNAVHRGYDAVFGVRRHRDDPALRLYLTRVIRTAVGMIFGVRLDDANVPFKLLRRSVWEEARPQIPPDTLAPSLFLAIVTSLLGKKILEIEVPHHRRDTGEVSIRRIKLLRFCARGLSQMIELRRRVRGSRPSTTDGR